MDSGEKEKDALIAGTGTVAQASAPVLGSPDIDLFLFGNNTRGEIPGLGRAQEKVPTPRWVAIPGRDPSSVAVTFACSGGHVLLTVGGELYAWGSNKAGQLGVHDLHDRFVPSIVRDMVSLGDVQQAVGGDNFTVVLTRSGRVYTMGSGSSGVLGIEREISLESLDEFFFTVTDFLGAFRRDRPTPVNALVPHTITEVACGSSHVLALTSNHYVFSWGVGERGQHGHGHIGLISIPRRMEFLSEVEQIACGLDHSLALTKSGDVFSWGKGENGQLGYGNEILYQLSPHPISLPSKVASGEVNVVKIAAGGKHSMLLLSDGSVIAFGNNGQGRCGFESGFINKGHVLVPRTVTSLAGHFVTDIACGRRHSVFLLRDGSVMVAGDNSRGQLGTGTTRAPKSPAKLRQLRHAGRCVRVFAGANVTACVVTREPPSYEDVVPAAASTAATGDAEAEKGKGKEPSKRSSFASTRVGSFISDFVTGLTTLPDAAEPEAISRPRSSRNEYPAPDSSNSSRVPASQGSSHSRRSGERSSRSSRSSSKRSAASTGSTPITRIGLRADQLPSGRGSSTGASQGSRHSRGSLGMDPPVGSGVTSGSRGSKKSGKSSKSGNSANSRRSKSSAPPIVVAVDVTKMPSPLAAPSSDDTIDDDYTPDAAPPAASASPASPAADRPLERISFGAPVAVAAGDDDDDDNADNNGGIRDDVQGRPERRTSFGGGQGFIMMELGGGGGAGGGGSGQDQAASAPAEPVTGSAVSSDTALLDLATLPAPPEGVAQRDSSPKARQRELA